MRDSRRKGSVRCDKTPLNISSNFVRFVRFVWLSVNQSPETPGAKAQYKKEKERPSLVSSLCDKTPLNISNNFVRFVRFVWPSDDERTNEPGLST